MKNKILYFCSHLMQKRKFEAIRKDKYMWYIRRFYLPRFQRRKGRFVV